MRARHDVPVAGALYWIGFVVSLVGVVVGVIGIWTTWQEYRSAGDRFWEPVYKAVRQFVVDPLRRSARQVKRFLGVTQSHSVEVHGATMTATAGHVRVRVSYGPLPDMEESEAFVAEVHRRTNDLLGRIQDVNEALQDEVKAMSGADEELRRELAELRAALESAAQRVALSGLRLEMSGLLLVVVGLIMQGLGQWMA